MHTSLLRTMFLAALLVLSALAASCGDDASGDTSAPGDTSNNAQTSDNGATSTNAGTTGATTDACPLGYLGCDCIAGTACFPGSDWVCVEGTCVEPECLVGTLGCACFGNGSCDTDEDGDFYVCDDGGICREAPCPEGTQGCPCDADSACEGDLTCQIRGGEAVCDVAGCEEGQAGCACAAGDACDGELVCQNNTCVEASCAPGTDACPCGPGGVCDGGLTCNDRDICEPIGCTPGAIGCFCDDDGACAGADAYCDDQDRCQRIDCPEGAEGCACSPAEVCGLSSGGEALTCVGGICRTNDCTPGMPGCVCTNGYACDGGTSCIDGFCQPDDCDAGTLHCACAFGGCRAGLVCEGGAICADGTGAPGGACLANGTCDRGARCLNDTCVACRLGTLGCGCDDADACNTGLVCQGDACVAQDDLDREPPAPEDQICYSPCNANWVVGDDVIVCNAQGLLEGCTNGTVCVEGSCVLPGQGPRTCLSDLDCPSHQACIDGQCYADCKYDQDCPDGMSCNGTVCRAPCSAEGNPCPTGFACDLIDGSSGFCVPQPVIEGDAPIVNQQPGSFELSTAAVVMSNVDVTGSFQIINNSPTTQRFTIKKLRHVVYGADATAERSVRANDGAVLGCDANAEDGDVCICGGDDDCGADFTCRLGACRPQSCVAGTCPLFWLQLGERDNTAQVQELEVSIEAGRGLTVEVGGSDGSSGVRWAGALEISNATLGNAFVELQYTEVPEGQWTGEMVYLASFGTNELEPWMADKDNVTLQERVGNALVQRWGAFRRGRISWDEFLAVLTATQTGSWKFPNVQQACSTEACYLYELGGVAEYSTDLDSVPIPSGGVELPMVMNLRLDNPDDPTSLVGRIVSEEALQYAGNPAVSLRFDNDPSTCTRQTPSACMVFIEEMEATAFVGGRYLTDSSDVNCAARAGDGYTLQAIPWLVPGFTEDTEVDAATGLRYRYACRDSRLPFDADEDADLALENTSLALSNPIPDGRSRRRDFSIVDGALINQNTLFILFRETFESFLGADDTEGFSAYGYMVLTRNPTDLDTEEEDPYAGTTGEDARTEPSDVLDVACDADILDQILDPGESLAEAPDKVVRAILSGVVAADPAVLTAQSEEQAHYLCFDTGQINGGPGVFDAVPAREACPADSEVAYFTLPNALITRRQIADLPCQENGSCLTTLNQWRANNHIIQDPPVWRCASDQAVYCDTNRQDLLTDKVFYAAEESDAVFVPLQSVIDNAFRYKTRFRNRRGENPGFTPEICVPNSNAIPYCYSPEEITSVTKRTDCLLGVWREHHDALSVETRAGLNAYLEVNFSYAEEFRFDQPTPIIHDGFEQLNAELLIMLGDERYTEAFASRFDLAGAATVSFEGSLFEDQGINLSGIAGYEMYSLYQATQYYQLALDRFYSQSPLIWEAIGYGNSARNFVTPETVIRYFDRLIRASTQKSRAWAEIAKRYNVLNRSDLAKRVAERAYTSTYLESVVLSRMMLRTVDVALPEDRAQIQKAVEDAQLSYRAALLDMQDVRATIGEALTVFGFAPDYIPFPALDSADFRQSNAFELLQRRVQSKLAVAAQRENVALESDRGFETSTAQFQSELTQIRNTYESQLGDICGTFVANDNQVYPAIEKYAYLDDNASLYGNPCGLLGNGQLHNQRAEIELAQLNITSAITRYENIIKEIDIETESLSAQCDLILERADYNYEAAGERRNLEQDIRDFRFDTNRIQSALSYTSQMLGYFTCSTEVCVRSAVAASAYTAAFAAAETGVSILEKKIQKKERKISNLDRETARWNTLTECDAATLQSNTKTATLALQLTEAELGIIRAEYRLRLAISGLDRLRNQARRLETEQKEAEQLAINVQAAQNNPNIRIYRNDAIINAEVSFQDAIREVYRLTRVFEYYTSQSYANRDDLFLVRMVSRGTPNLENYVAELNNAFFEFEELFGLPETRAEIISLRDDVFRVPELDEDGLALDQGDRYRRFVNALTDPARLDSNGYIVIPFSTRLDAYSPLTRNHKVLFVEIDVRGTGLGDTLGRFYLRQTGTGMIRTVDDDRLYYQFDPRTAVINTIFNGNRDNLDSTALRNYRFRDRPLVNTNWELVINQRDEAVNQDINLSGLSDIRIFVYYGDLTPLP